MKYLLLLLVVCSCTDAKMAKLSNLGSSAEIKCYSGGNIIYHGKSTGKVSSEERSDGYYFRDKETGGLKEVSGDCIINYID